MVLITFSGVDGCGKSTHATLTREFLERSGLRVAQFATLKLSLTGIQTLLRERRQAKRTRRDNGRHQPEQPRIRSYPMGHSFDQDRRRLSVRLRRVVAYPIDCIAMRLAIGLLRLARYDAVICDRYTFDKLVALPKKDGPLGRLVRWLAPKPNHAFLLDASPETAIARRREHQDDYYVTKCREYRELAAMNCGLISIKSTSIGQVQARIEAAIQTSVRARQAKNQSTHRQVRRAKAH